MKLITHLLLAQVFRHDFLFKVVTGTVRVSPNHQNLEHLSK